MKISLSWLNDYVDVKDFFAKPDELARVLTAAGLEVEGFEDPSKSFQHVVVGQVVELGKHPNADKLTLCQIDVGDGRQRQIVCGAKNHRQGDKVVVALPGAVLPGDFAIKLSKIRDVESQGMLCSESELGFKAESEGIVILPKDAPVGKPFAEYSGRQDIILEINVTPNRADCLSHIGLAREVSCLLDRTLKLPENKIKTGAKATKSHIDVKLVDAELCPRYAGRSVFGVKVGPSPEWLSQRLQAVGLNSINNVVDITNFVMMEYGQPLHAFDAKELRGEKIIVEKAKPHEKFKTFDGTELELVGEELTIRDGERAVALAGVIGGVNSGVTDKTSDIFIEAAHFNPRGVRRSSRRHGLETDSCHRFSRGTDPENVLAAMDRAASLIQQVAGGEVGKDFYDLYPHPLKRKPITVRKSILEDRLGYKVDLKDFTQWMSRLHCKAKVSGETVVVETPAFRVDLEIEMDLVEEYARLHGYDKIPENFPALRERPTDFAPSFLAENRVGDLARGEGFLEARNYAFVSAKWQRGLWGDGAETDKILSGLGLAIGGLPVDIRNPLSEETGQMRQSLLTGLLTNLLHNYHRGSHHGRLFETGYVFAKSAGGEGHPLYKESHRLSLLAWGQKSGLWAKAEASRPVIYDVKGAIEGIVSRLQGQVQWRKADKLPGFAHPGQAATIFYEGRVIGFVAALHPAFREDHKLRHEVAVAEIDLAVLMRGQPRVAKLDKLSKFPAVERDLAFVLPLELPTGDVVKEITKAGAPLLQSAEVFDVFRGAGVPEGHQSVAIKMVLQDANATLSDEQLTTVLLTVTTAVEKKFGVKRRG